MAIKLDMSKAFDRVNWDFLETVMNTMGLGLHVRNLIIFCVCSVTFSIKINGEAQGQIFPSCGLRQGDPLSPYLFLIVTEGLIALLTEIKNRSLIQGIKIYREVPSINHLLFVDDTLVFCSAVLGENRNLLDLLAVYERSFGQSIHREKTELSFSRNVSRETQHAIMVLWGFETLVNMLNIWDPNSYRQIQKPRLQ